MNPIDTMIQNETKVTTLKSWLKSFPEEHHPAIEARIVEVKDKPKTLEYKLQFFPNGGVKFPASAYLDHDGGHEYINSVINELIRARDQGMLQKHPKHRGE